MNTVMTNTEFAQSGHYWAWNTDQNQYQLCWNPIKNQYTPPKYFQDIHCVRYRYQDRIPISRLIGKDGFHFKEISRLSKAPYIFYRKEEDVIEFWGNPSSIQYAIYLLERHIQHCKLRYP